MARTGRPSKRTPAVPPHTVYVLEDECGRIRYVGVTSNTKRRLGQHIREARRTESHRANWVMSMVSRGLSPTLRVVETGVADWNEAERRWIAKCRNDGCDLVNGNDGGFATSVRMRLGRRNYPNVGAFMRRLGQHAMFMRVKPDAPFCAQVRSRRFFRNLEHIRASMKRARREGRMDLVEAKARALAERKGWTAYA